MPTCQMCGQFSPPAVDACSNCGDDFASFKRVARVTSLTCGVCGSIGFESDKICRECGKPFRATRSLSRGFVQAGMVLTVVSLAFTGTAWPWLGLLLSSVAVWSNSQVRLPRLVVVMLAILIPAPMIFFGAQLAESDSAHDPEIAFELGFRDGVQAANEAMNDGRTQRFALYLDTGSWCCQPILNPSRSEIARGRRTAGFRAGARSVLPPDAGNTKVAIEQLLKRGAKFFRSNRGRAIVLSGMQVTDESVQFIQAIPHLTCVVVNSTQLTDECVVYLRSVPTYNLVIGETKLTADGIDRLIRGCAEKRSGVQKLWLDREAITVGLIRMAIGQHGIRPEPLPAHCRSDRELVERVVGHAEQKFADKHGRLLW